jgi:hypothetical protein
VTEYQWLREHDVFRLLDQATGCMSLRKWRLFACACCRRFEERLPSEAARHVLEVAERAADREASVEELADARAAVELLQPRDAAEWASNCASCTACRSAEQAALSAYSTSAMVARTLGQAEETIGPYYVNLLREIVGNPFRAVTVSEGVRTPTVISLAQAAYRERLMPGGILDALRLGALAEALEEVGANDALAAHLRSPGPHVRGCWAVDRILGKE